MEGIFTIENKNSTFFEKKSVLSKSLESLDKYELADPYRNKRSTMVLRQSALQTATDRVSS